MRRVQLIELGILAVTLIAGYRTIEFLVSTLITSFYINSYQTIYGELILYNILQLAVYVIIFFLLIWKRKQIAFLISGKEANEDIPIRIEKTGLLHIIIIAVCIAAILPAISTFLIYVFDYFKEEAGRYKRFDTTDTSGQVTLVAFKTAAVKMILAFVLLYFSKPLSNYLSKGLVTDVVSTDDNEPQS